MKVKFYGKQGIIVLTISIVASFLIYYFFKLDEKNFADIARPALFIKKGLKAAGVILIMGLSAMTVLSFFMPLLISEVEEATKISTQHPELLWDPKCLIFSREYLNIKVESGKNHPALVPIERISSSISLEKESSILSQGIVTEDEEVNDFFNTMEVNNQAKEEKTETPQILDVDSPLVEEEKQRNTPKKQPNEFIDKNNIDDMY
ncbi:MAG: DUF3112 domain-containing protein [Raineya sp.]|jgi:hypothetical protein|nr:DUF3112 domain-containing protein [Raineya sp.]